MIVGMLLDSVDAVVNAKRRLTLTLRLLSAFIDELPLFFSEKSTSNRQMRLGRCDIYGCP